MAIDETDDEIETEEETPKKKGKTKGKRRPGGVPAGSPEVALNGGARVIPPKPPGVAAKIKARTFNGWVASLCKRESPPHHFVCELADGETKSIQLTKSRSGSVLIGECVSTIEMFEPVKVEGFSRNEDTGEEHTLGWWVFPAKEGAPAEENATPALALAPMPGYLPEEGDSDAIRLLKSSVHMIADAYRYNAEANKGMLDSMARVMEMQANAFARERESMTKTVQATENLARLKRDRFRIAAPGAADVVQGRDDDGEAEAEEEARQEGNSLFDTMMQTAVTEFVRQKVTASAAAAPATEAPKAAG